MADITGNTIILETERKEYLLFAHIKANSILLFKEGDLVKQGQVIAKCGNSGNTTQAHLHFQLQNTDDLFNTIGAKIYFDEVIVNGEIKKDYMPKEDFVGNIKDSPMNKKHFTTTAIIHFVAFILLRNSHYIQAKYYA